MRCSILRRDRSSAVRQSATVIPRVGHRGQLPCKRLQRCVAETASIPTEELASGEGQVLRSAAPSPEPASRSTPEQRQVDDGLLELDSVLEREMLADNGERLTP